MLGKVKLLFLSLVLILLFAKCHSTSWNSLNLSKATNLEHHPPPEKIQAIFANYPDSVMRLDCKSPAYAYQYDVGEKDELYGSHHTTLQFKTLEIRLKNKMAANQILVDFTFVDGQQNKIHINDIDLLRWALQLNAPDELLTAELLLEEYNRFGFNFRKEHKEFRIELNPEASAKVKEAAKRAYRCNITNNCLAPTKWEFALTAEDYSDFSSRLKAKNNLNQNKILSHSWFYLDSNLYNELLKIKNPSRAIPQELHYDSLSNWSEKKVVDWEKLRNPIKHQSPVRVLEIGHKTARKIKPLDVEEFYKRKFGLILSQNNLTYSSILESPVKTTKFQAEGFYRADTPNEFDFSWMKYADDVSIDIVDIKGSDTYAEITIKGKWAAYNINLGNIDLSLINEQKLYGFLFGFNTYPKGRRYNPKQNTIAYDADLLPKEKRPYLLMTDAKTGKWVNNQYKGVEKIYLTYESLERDVLLIYILSYERITPIWMARVKLPQQLRQKIRIRKGLYNY